MERHTKQNLSTTVYKFTKQMYQQAVI